MSTLPRDREFATYGPECGNRNAGYKPTWGIGDRWADHLIKDANCQETKHYVDEKGRVLLGQKDVADRQRESDEKAGGLVFLALNRR